jgi:hypothetical protein
MLDEWTLILHNEETLGPELAFLERTIQFLGNIQIEQRHLVC